MNDFDAINAVIDSLKNALVHNESSISNRLIKLRMMLNDVEKVKVQKSYSQELRQKKLEPLRRSLDELQKFGCELEFRLRELGNVMAAVDFMLAQTKDFYFSNQGEEQCGVLDDLVCRGSNRIEVLQMREREAKEVAKKREEEKRRAIEELKATGMMRLSDDESKY